jgi:HAMP domain-containing protein
MQKMEIQVMELRNYEGMLSENENKLTMLSQEMLRLNQVLGGKEDELSNLRQAVQRLTQQLKEQAEW